MIIQYYHMESVFKVILQSIIDQSLSFLYFYNFIINFLYFSSIWFFMPQMALVLLVKLEPSSSEFHIKNILLFRKSLSWLFILTIIPLILYMKCSKYEYWICYQNTPKTMYKCSAILVKWKTKKLLIKNQFVNK